MRKIITLAALCLFLAALLTANRWLTEKIRSVSEEAGAGEGETVLAAAAGGKADAGAKGSGKVVLDAGHGGADPGKVSEEGVLEKDLNLVITRRLAKELEEAGVEVILTRTGDEEPGKDQAEAGSRKLADLKARTERINEEYPDLAVSIHQNSYPDPSVRGVQVFYYGRSEAGERMAVLMEKAFREGLPEETRVRDSKANEEYYLLRNTEVPAIILECGFLSCPEELSLLMDQDYQEQFCKAAARGILACMGK